MMTIRDRLKSNRAWLLAGALGLAVLAGLSGCTSADAGTKVTLREGVSAGYTHTRYPIVLVHGFLGFDNIGFFEYFHGIPAALRSGRAMVFTPQLSAINSTEARGEQLLLEVKRIIAVTGEDKVNLIGHSHGAPTARYVASVQPDLVASVTSVGGRQQGFGDIRHVVGHRAARLDVERCPFCDR